MPSPSEKQLLEAIDEFVGLIDAVLPESFPTPVGWPFFARAFLAKFRSQLVSIAVLIKAGQQGEALYVLRAVYESVVIFCWLGAEPRGRLLKWVDNSQRGRNAALREARDDFGVDPPPGEESSLEARIERLELIQRRAKEADEYWSEEIQAFRPVQKGPLGLLTLSGFYTAVYRNLSRHAHAEVDALESVTEIHHASLIVSAGGSTRSYEESLGLVIPFVGLALVVYHELFGGLDPEKINEINRELVRPDEEDEGGESQ